MEYLAKIIHNRWLTDKQVWKYEFLNIENNQSDYFYHREPITYKPNVLGKLNITRDKFFKSFEQEVNKMVGGFEETEKLVKFGERTYKIVEKVTKRLPKRQIEVSPQKLHELHNQGYTWKEVGAIYGKSEPTMYRWIKKDEKPPQKRGRKPIVNNEVINLVRSYTLENKVRTQQEVANHVYKELGIRISQPSICFLLKSLGITYKKLTYHYTQLDKEKAKAFNEEIKPLLLNNQPFIALDECSFYPNLDPRYGYALKSERAVEKRPSYKGKHYTLLFAISNLKEKGIIHWKLTGEKVDWKVFYDFLEEINPIGDKKNYLLMDNARIHTAFNKRSEKGLSTVEEQMARKNTEVRFITTYAPMLNPTELVFCLFRQQTEKNRPRNFEEMELAIKKVVELLNTKDLRKYFWHCATYFDRKEKETKTKLRKTITNF